MQPFAYSFRLNSHVFVGEIRFDMYRVLVVMTTCTVIKS